jgi:iron complex outermembrane recepter protein
VAKLLALGRRVPIKGYSQAARGEVIVIRANRQHCRVWHAFATALTLATLGAAESPCGAAAAAEDSESSSPESAAPAGTQPPLEEVIVTARKREEKAIEVPFSLQVVDSKDLTELGAVDFSDYARTVAGVSFEDKGAGRWTIFMRGVSTGSDVDTGLQSSVGIYFDEVPISEDSSQPDLKLYDMDRIEVLRGPQGTLFGSGSLSGTLRMLPKQPDLTGFSGEAGAQVSETEHGGLNYAVDGIVNLPLSPITALRIVAYKDDNDGFLTNGFSGARDINFEHSNGGRAALLLRPSDNLDITLNGIYQEGSFGEYYQVTDHFPALIIDEAETEPFVDRYSLAALKINYDFGLAKLTSVTSYYDRNRFFQNDIDYFTGLLGLPRAYSPLTYTARTMTQELRLASTGEGPLSWLIGSYFENHHETSLQSVSAAGEPVPPPSDQLVNIDQITNDRQYALFGEANYKLTSQLTFTAGLRASRIDQDNTSIDNGTLYGGQTYAQGTNSNTPVTPRAILSYMPDEHYQIYVQASKGFRIGGVNPGLPPCLPQNGCTVNVGTTFGPDSVWNYEVGTKLQAFDSRLSLDADVFYIDWTDIQINVDRGDGFNGFMNAGKAVVKGLELSPRLQVNPHLRVGGQFTYTDGKITELGTGLAATGVAAVGDAVPAVPKIATSGFAELGTSFSNDGWAYVRGDVSYTTTRYGSFASTAPIPLLPYSLGSIRFGIDKGLYSTSLFVNNVTDRRAMLAVQNYSGVHDGEPYSWLRYNVNVPRTIGLAFSRRF